MLFWLIDLVRHNGLHGKLDRAIARPAPVEPGVMRFNGIITRMYFAPTEHPPSNFHVYYCEQKATVDMLYKTADLGDG